MSNSSVNLLGMSRRVAGVRAERLACAFAGVLLLGLLSGCGTGNKQSSRSSAPAGSTSGGSLFLSSLTPVTGSTQGQTAVTLSGQGFTAGAVVEFGGSPARGVAVVSSTQITCKTPAHPVDLVDVVVTSSSGASSRLNNAFTFVSLPSKTILVVDDPLDQSTTGTQTGGNWMPQGGWQVTAGSRITYDLGGTYSKGRLEIDLLNFLPQTNQLDGSKCHLMTMWQGINHGGTSAYNAGEAYWIFRTYDNNVVIPTSYKFFTRPTTFGSAHHDKRIDGGFPWDPSTTYHYVVSWDDGRVVMKKEWQGQSVTLYDHTFNPDKLFLGYLLLGRDQAGVHANQPGVIFSNVRVYVDQASKL